jgi:hypothetical protein
VIEAVTKYSIERHIRTIDRLHEDSERAFGTLDATGMLRHLRFVYEMSIGEQEIEDDSKPIIRTLLWIFAFNVFTEWPGGKIKGPPSLTPVPEHSFDEERVLLVEAMRRFVTKLETDPDEEHVNPGLGPISITKWSHLHGVHSHHHYKQFDLEDEPEVVV